MGKVATGAYGIHSQRVLYLSWKSSRYRVNKSDDEELLEENSPSDKTDKSRYTLRLHQTLVKRIDQHLFCLHFIENAYLSKRSWIISALQEKLDLEEHRELPKLPKPSAILLEIDAKILSRLMRQMSIIRKIKGSYSMKSWMIDAIEEKLEREAYKAAKIAEKIRLPS